MNKSIITDGVADSPEEAFKIVIDRIEYFRDLPSSEIVEAFDRAAIDYYLREDQ